MQQCRITGTSFKIIVENEKQMELSFTRTWDPSVQGEHAPLYIDKRYSEEVLNPFIFET